MEKLYTDTGQNLQGIPWDQYPRPQMVRSSWLNLNGIWDIEHNGIKSKILVPFSPESLLSDFKDKIDYNENFIYSKDFFIPHAWLGKKIKLNIGAINRHAEIYINDIKVGSHENGYLPFSFDITKYLRDGSNTIKIIANNDLSPLYPWGKQKIKRGGMWYTPVSGIWQTIWLEPVPLEEEIQSISFKNTSDSIDISVKGPKEGYIVFEDKKYPLENGFTHIDIQNPINWTPENPYLYRFKVKTITDEIDSYFALRTLEIKEINGIKRLLLNGKPYYFHGLLDQGYWSDGLYTPPSPQSYEDDIKKMKSLGFNTLRKHIKIEPEQFYYDCDRLGMIVFQDMVNNGNYHFIRDTVLPTLGFLNKRDKNYNKNKNTRINFLTSMEETVTLLKNHPSIMLWTIFNEGWGQFDADYVYEKLKELDNTRFIDSTSGWFHQNYSDVDSLHIYFKELHLGKEDKAQILSEFGGYSYKLMDHSFNLEETYGYKKFENKDDFIKALRNLYLKELIPLIKEGLNGSIYTQVSDVEDETNGLITFDRKVLKVKPKEFYDISKKIKEIINE